jgi:nitrogen regulatory protein PII
MKEIPNIPGSSQSKVPFEKSRKLEQIDFFLAVVPDGQGVAIVQKLIATDAAVCFLTHGKGTATSDFYEVMGLGENHKQVVMSLIRETKWPLLRESLRERFTVSDYTKGIGFIIRIDSLCGVSVYKMLTDDRGLSKGETAMAEPIIKKDDYEVVMVIVNDGFTDLVMDAAKKAGARGGTILTARGTGNKDIEKFFGVVITPEKQIVMILVPKKIKDDVIGAIYKEVGINTKGQGIAFAMPATDVVGIVEGEKTDGKPEEGK